MVQRIGTSLYDHIRPGDVEVFRDATRKFQVHILVRRTNTASLQYIGRPGYIPKPIDCKPKTADRDVVLPSGLIVRCGGLVVNPSLPGFDKAFASSGKLDKARDAWSRFEREHGMGAAITSGKTYLDGYSLEKTGETYAFTLNRGGIYLMNPFPEHAHYGCLMFCPFQLDAPFAAGDKSALEAFVFRKTNGYLHGDYDLYGIVPAGRPGQKTLERSLQHGVENLCSERFGEISEFLNRRMGAPMIQHGGQESMGHADDHLDVFWANGDITEVAGRAAIEKLYRQAFHDRKAGP